LVDGVYSGKGPPGALKICILSDEEYHPWNPQQYLNEYDWELFILNRLNSVRTVQELVKRNFDIYFNLCDASWYEPYPGPEVIKVLEHAEVAFTGADSAFYDPSREDMKRVCRYFGILTPAGVEAYDTVDIKRAATTLHFPLIVKSINSYASMGIDRESRVETFDALAKQSKRIIREFGGALIEEFIDGDEYTLLVVENADDPYDPVVYPPIRYIFPGDETFDHYEAKWVLDKYKRFAHCEDPELTKRLIDAGRKLFIGLNGVGYGRCDIRVNTAGEVFLLEINPNCAILFPFEQITDSSDRVLLEHPEGHRGFLHKIFNAALARQKRLRKKWFVRYSPERGYALFARRAIVVGETILPLEKRPHTLVSRNHVEQTWKPEQQQLFKRHAYPLTDELWVVLSDNPAEWTPINHSCNPNAWWDGLDIVARRSISEGEEITLDYATFHNEVMPEFRCTCGAVECREIIQGTDYLQPYVERYEGHVTDYVKRKRMTSNIIEEIMDRHG